VTQALPPQTLEQSVTIYTIFQNFCFHRWQRSRTTFGYLVQIVTSAAFPFQLPRLTAEKSPNHAQIPQINKSSSLVDQSICQNTVKVVRSTRHFSCTPKFSVDVTFPRHRSRKNRKNLGHLRRGRGNIAPVFIK
jgi:hypothetical protein